MTGSEFVFVYSTFPDAASAQRAGEAVVGAKLAACVNLLPPMTSIYEWDGRMEVTPEVAALMKTRRVCVDALVEKLRGLHPYTVPCFLVLPISGGNEDYLSWVRKQTESG